MPLHCKACDSPIESDKEYVCSTCLSVAMRMIPKKLLSEEAKVVSPPKQEEVQWTTDISKAA